MRTSPEFPLLVQVAIAIIVLYYLAGLAYTRIVLTRASRAELAARLTADDERRAAAIREAGMARRAQRDRELQQRAVAGIATGPVLLQYEADQARRWGMLR